MTGRSTATSTAPGTALDEAGFDELLAHLPEGSDWGTLLCTCRAIAAAAAKGQPMERRSVNAGFASASADGGSKAMVADALQKGLETRATPGELHEQGPDAPWTATHPSWETREAIVRDDAIPRENCCHPVYLTTTGSPEDGVT